MKNAKDLPAGRQAKTILVTEPPKIPSLNFGRKTGFAIRNQGPAVKSFIPQTTRITQHKGGTSGAGK